MATARKKAARRKPAAKGQTARGKPLKDPAGGLTAAGRAHFAKTEGAHLRPGVSGKADTPEKKARKGSFLRRHFANPQGPMERDGEPTRLASRPTPGASPSPTPPPTPSGWPARASSCWPSTTTRRTPRRPSRRRRRPRPRGRPSSLQPRPGQPKRRRRRSDRSKRNRERSDAGQEEELRQARAAGPDQGRGDGRRQGGPAGPVERPQGAAAGA